MIQVLTITTTAMAIRANATREAIQVPNNTSSSTNLRSITNSTSNIISNSTTNSIHSKISSSVDSTATIIRRSRASSTQV